MSRSAAYFNNSYLFCHTTTISTTAQDENGYYIILDQTIFYPQGGGQPYDLGVAQTKEANIPIHAVKKVESEIRHYTDSDYSHLTGLLDLQGFAIRSGHMCAQPVMRHYSLSHASRASVVFYNTLDEIYQFADTLKKIITQLR